MTFLCGFLTAVCIIWLVPSGARRLATRQRGGDEAYADLDVHVLNTLPPQTEWMNMGWWVDAKTLPEACERLALRLYESCGLDVASSSSAAILDVGHGAGESLLLLRRRFRPRILHGVTLSPRDASRAEQRLRDDSSGDDLRITAADGARFLVETAAPASYDYIFALDCAYHFSGSSRSAFFAAAHRALKAGGKLGLFDLCASRPYPGDDTAKWFTPSPSLPRPTREAFSIVQEWKLRLFCLITSTPRRNLVSFDEYAQLLNSVGFKVQVQDVSHNVFPGFAAFLARFAKGDVWRAGAGGWKMRTALGSFAGFVEDWATGGDVGMLRGAIVVATK